MRYLLPLFFLFPVLVSAVSIEGAWLSDCQNVDWGFSGYRSLRPIDTFDAKGRASLRVHVFEDRNCQGKEWDEEIIYCTYQIGNPLLSLPSASELDLVCDLNGTLVFWYEIVERKERTLRYGNQTGTTPLERPKVLGNVFYRLMETEQFR